MKYMFTQYMYKNIDKHTDFFNEMKTCHLFKGFYKAYFYRLTDLPSKEGSFLWVLQFLLPCMIIHTFENVFYKFFKVSVCLVTCLN